MRRGREGEGEGRRGRNGFLRGGSCKGGCFLFLFVCLFCFVFDISGLKKLGINLVAFVIDFLIFLIFLIF